MKSIAFPQANCELAKDQPRYETLHVFADMKEYDVIGALGVPTGKKEMRPESMTACMELSEEEISDIVRTKRIWHTQMLFGNNFQPIIMSTQNPFE